ncbi:F-box protein PP2-B15 [Sesamum angolense]|uniref:F-box protein PP2-B15 n=1 Tax=Sesamum angolense TaxID=2727404 RepID=A0AAE1WYV8_9LAMI|nr:F-box protein PP2-B15 [Sesamum angolense]
MAEALPEDCLSHVISFTFSLATPAVLPLSPGVSAAQPTPTSPGRNSCRGITARLSPSRLLRWSSLPLRNCLASFPLLPSLVMGGRRFPEAVELIMLCWLDIRGKINTRMLSPNTTYGAYLVIQLANRAFGLGALPFEVSIEVGDYKTRGRICMKRDECKSAETLHEGEEGVLHARGDGWLEVELGEFYNNGNEKEAATASPHPPELGDITVAQNSLGDVAVSLQRGRPRVAPIRCPLLEGARPNPGAVALDLGDVASAPGAVAGNVFRPGPDRPVRPEPAMCPVRSMPPAWSNPVRTGQNR